jgi:tRNA-specific 2-thiouridylase
MIKAVGLLSGGLDSTLAAKLLIDQGIEVHAVNFVSPFCTCTPKSAGCASVVTAVRQLGDIPLKRIVLGSEYLDMVRAPRHGYGRGMNPCIDCRILKIKKAAEYMREIGAQFLFTGEVLGQRPMSQHRRALELIDRQSGVGDLILRPLSAGVLKPTACERSGLVDRHALLSISGRSRKPQIALAKDKGINEYRCPAGGCLLTNELFAERLREYLAWSKAPDIADMPLLKIGRHFFKDNSGWIIVARDEQEGERLERVHRPDAVLFVPENFSGPLVLLIGKDRAPARGKMIEFTKHEIPDPGVIREIDGMGTTAIVSLPKQVDSSLTVPAS